MLEQVQVNERYKMWVDECCKIFGGLDVVVVEAIQGKDGKEYIVGINDSAMTLLGESQEEDRKHIAELTLAKMQAFLKPVNTNIKSSNTSSVIGYTMNGNGSGLGTGSIGQTMTGSQPNRPPLPAGAQQRPPDPRAQQGLVQQQWPPSTQHGSPRPSSNAWGPTTAAAPAAARTTTQTDAPRTVEGRGGGHHEKPPYISSITN
ncbi:SYN-like protein [Mya arenaria]|uniref:SYN-like protein n=1 Tax=Mya arenaria TaxID=6604 RepID=A0ABY7FTU8_MYAAR|nr:SYN-like protein [Mya arenaria]